MWHFTSDLFGSLVSFDKGTRSVGGGVAVLSALGKCAELLCNFGISFEKCSLKQVWQLFSTNLPNLWFSAHFPCLHCSNLQQPFKSHY